MYYRRRFLIWKRGEKLADRLYQLGAEVRMLIEPEVVTEVYLRFGAAYFSASLLQILLHRDLFRHCHRQCHRPKSRRGIGVFVGLGDQKRRILRLEAAVGVEPTNSSFANCCLRPLGDAAELWRSK